MVPGQFSKALLVNITDTKFEFKSVPTLETCKLFHLMRRAFGVNHLP